MTEKNKDVDETTKEFLFYHFTDTEGHLEFATQWKEYQKQDLPSYIQDNLSQEKELRPYQVEAIKRYMFLLENESTHKRQTKHLLFNMATGSGKTLVMAGLILYLYEKGYRNFLFLVHFDNIRKQAIDNFITLAHSKYLFNNKVSFNGRCVDVNRRNNFTTGYTNDINMVFMNTQLFHRHFENGGENRMIKEVFEKNKVIILADEAHHNNAFTRKNIPQTKEEKENWEGTIMSALNANKDNKLLEFTATTELSDKKINEKYRNKILYKYTFKHFNKQGYSKNVSFLYNDETSIERQRRLLIVNAVALSEYRKILFEDIGQPNITPIVLLKSTKIEKSKEDKEYFNDVILSLRSKDFEYLKNIKDKDGIITSLFGYLKKEDTITEQDFIDRIKNAFTGDRAIIYNSKQKQHKDVLQQLDNQNDPRKPIIRAVFSVNALNEGWDVLSLYDIIHFDIAENKKVSVADIQFIGRGSRYCPFEVKQAKGGLLGTFETDRYKRKFDKAIDDRKILDYFYYHFVETGNFREKLEVELNGKGIMSEEKQHEIIELKEGFKNSQTYKKGFVLQNDVRDKTKITEHEEAHRFNEPIDIKKLVRVRRYEPQTRQFNIVDTEHIKRPIKRTDDFFIKNAFSSLVLKKALMRAENGFFRFNNLQKHIPNLKSIDDFIKNGLTPYKFNYSYYGGKEYDKIEHLPPENQLDVLVEYVLPEVRKRIDTDFPQKEGTDVFRPFPISEVFSITKYVPIKTAQTNEEGDLQLDIGKLEWYAYNENYGTSEEKRLVVVMNNRIDDLFKKYRDAEIYLVRNELEYWMYQKRNGQRFSPDYLLFINDWKNKNFYYQCIFEPKGEHLEHQDKWKEKMLKELESTNTISLEIEQDNETNNNEYLKKVKEMGYKKIRNIGFSFFNENNTLQFEKELEKKLLDK